jgi:hypothetical protein
VCPTGTRNPDGLCRRCSGGGCRDEDRRPEWMKRASAKDETYADWTETEMRTAWGDR